MSSSGEMKEGFLCPICMTDLGDVIQLQVHFEERHAKEDPAFIQSLKDLFGKAKKKMLNNENPNEDGIAALATSLGQEVKNTLLNAGGKSGPDPEVEGRYHPVSGVLYELYDEEKSESLPRTNHTSYFKQERKKRVERNKSTNQLLLRLEKLMRDLPHDPSKRRSHEKRIVPWIPEETVKLCPMCAKSFNLARRKHHCRLCGAVLCADCSVAVSLDFARRILNPASRLKLEAEVGAHNPAPPPEKVEEKSLLSTLSSKLTPSKKFGGSSESLNSMLDLKRGDEAHDFRSCRLCREILDNESRKQESDLDLNKPILVQFYGRLLLHMDEGREAAEKYKAMASSLNAGEESHDLEEAKFMRVRVLKIAENVDIISKKIANLGRSGEGARELSQLEQKLQLRIRTMAVNYVKETLIAGMPGLPGEEELEVLKKKRVEEAEKRVESEREAAKKAKVKFEQDAVRRTKSMMPSSGNGQQSKAKSKNGTKIDYGSGFVLTSAPSATDAHLGAMDDPMVQQIRNIKHFITEARKMGKYDEVASLEANLKDLQEEYQRMQGEREELEGNFEEFRGMFHKTSPLKERLDPVGEADDPPLTEDQVDELDEYDSSGKNPFF